MSTPTPSLAELVAEGHDVVALFNAHRGPFDLLVGLTFTAVSEDRVEATVPVRAELTQPYGLVHGGVYCAIVETLASAGAAIAALPRGQSVVGLENTTTFLRGTREGTLRATATPLQRGRRSQVWNVDIADGEGRLVASGRVRALCLEPGSSVGGEAVALKTP